MKEFKRPITKIILHTAAYRGKANEELIRKWHWENGWDDIGYHYVITGSFYDDKAEIQIGRPIGLQGAHAYGMNGSSIGICMTGHGDHMEWTDAQLKLLKNLVNNLLIRYNLRVEDVIGHRETWVEKIKKRKTCPGKLIDMKEIRKYLLSQDEEI